METISDNTAASQWGRSEDGTLTGVEDLFPVGCKVSKCQKHINVTRCGPILAPEQAVYQIRRGMSRNLRLLSKAGLKGQGRRLAQSFQLEGILGMRSSFLQTTLFREIKTFILSSSQRPLSLGACLERCFGLVGVESRITLADEKVHRWDFPIWPFFPPIEILIL
jgi:hypothetical protein